MLIKSTFAELFMMIKDADFWFVEMTFPFLSHRAKVLEMSFQVMKGRPQRKYMDAFKKDIKFAAAQEIDIQDGIKWRKSIRCVCFKKCREKTKEKEDSFCFS